MATADVNAACKLEASDDNGEPNQGSQQVSTIERELSLRSGFTSENYKIELRNLPKFFGVSQAKKLLMKNKLNYHKIKPAGNLKAGYMFINFVDDEDRNKAIEVLNGFTLKGKSLQAFKAKPAKDPLLKKRQEQEQQGGDLVADPTSAAPAGERLCSAVCPLHVLPYEEQLVTKMTRTQEVMELLKEEIKKAMAVAGITHPSAYDLENLVQVKPTVASPSINGYRNKCEFSVGLHPDNGVVTVGFRLGGYRQGSLGVVGVDDLPIVSDKMKLVVKAFELHIRSSGLVPFSSLSNRGYWKQLTLRESTADHGGEGLMAWVIIDPQGMTSEDREKVSEGLKECTRKLKEEDKNCDVTSLLVQYAGRRRKGEKEAPIELLFGEPFIKEKMLGLDFLISPKAFFQVNSKAASLVYQTVEKLADIDENTTVLDVCCGTGAIGLCLAARCKEVLGVDIEEQAVKDANENAKRNNVTNAHFFAGKAENLLNDLFRRARGSRVVAVVDPPRAGLHPRAVQALRASKVQTLVFVSCDARAASSSSFLPLAKPPSKTNHQAGDPFLPRAVVPVDLFPHTNHVETVILFKRMAMDDIYGNMKTEGTQQEERTEGNTDEI